MRVEVQHNYAANSGGRKFGPWAEGDVVEVDDADAAWVNHDSPGALRPVDGETGEVTAPGEPLPEDPAEGDVVEVDDADAADETPKPKSRRGGRSRK